MIRKFFLSADFVCFFFLVSLELAFVLPSNCELFGDDKTWSGRDKFSEMRYLDEIISPGLPMASVVGLNLSDNIE